MPEMIDSHATVDVTIPTGGVNLNGSLQLPKNGHGLVVFVHGSGSSRFSPRNRQVAGYLLANNIGTLLMDLLTPEEEQIDAITRELRFDIPLLARRVADTLDWLALQEHLRNVPIGLFGASTGAAAALVAAAEKCERVSAVVSRGGRPDLAGDSLAAVRAPTLLIVGGNDLEVLSLNYQAMRSIPAITHLHVVPGASHLFEEPGTLAQVAQQAALWFKRYLTGGDAAAR